MKKYLKLLVIIIGLSTTAHASLDCRKECVSDPNVSQCIHFGYPVKYAVKTLLDIVNQYVPSPVPNFSHSPCERQMFISDVYFENTGDACREYTVSPIDEPGDPVDPDNQIYVKLPTVIKGQYVSESQKIAFAGSNFRPVFESTSDGEVWTSESIDSAFLLNVGSEINLVLESQSMCYSIFVH